MHWSHFLAHTRYMMINDATGKTVQVSAAHSQILQ